MTWHEFLTAVGYLSVPAVPYAIGWLIGYQKGKDAGIYQELTRKANR